MFPALVCALLCTPTPAHADALERGLYQVGGGLAGGVIGTSGTFIGRVLAGYVVLDNMVVGIDAAHSFVGAPTGRVSASWQYYFGYQFIRLMVGVQVGALNTHGVTGAGLGVELGMPLFLTKHFALVPELMLEGNFFSHLQGAEAGVATAGVNVRYAF